MINQKKVLYMEKHMKEIYGIEKAKKIKKKICNSMKGKQNTLGMTSF